MNSRLHYYRIYSRHYRYTQYFSKHDIILAASFINISHRRFTALDLFTITARHTMTLALAPPLLIAEHMIMRRCRVASPACLDI